MLNSNACVESLSADALAANSLVIFILFDGDPVVWSKGPGAPAPGCSEAAAIAYMDSAEASGSLLCCELTGKAHVPFEAVKDVQCAICPLPP